MIHDVEGTIKYKNRRYEYEAQIFNHEHFMQDDRLYNIHYISPSGRKAVSCRQIKLLEVLAIEDAKDRVMLLANKIPNDMTIEELTKKLANGRNPRPGFEWYLSGTGQLVSVHGRDRCRGDNCVIHRPSNHHMRTWPTHWREDRGLMERICEHGCGHCDYDVARYHESIGDTTFSIHGCDGCCHGVSSTRIKENYVNEFK